MISFLSLEIVEIGDFFCSSSIVFFWGDKGMIYSGGSSFLTFCYGGGGGRVGVVSKTGFRLSGGKEFDFGSTTRVGLVKLWENLLFQI